MVSKVGGAGNNAKIFMPTQDQLKQVYGSMAQKALKDGVKPLKHAPKGIEKYSSIDVTPKGEMGSDQKVYTYKGELYLKTTPVVPNAKSTWYKIGPMPMF